MKGPEERRTQARVLRNDERIVAAAIARASEHGYAGLRIAAIAADVGLAHRTVQLRYPNRTAIAIGIWEAQLAAVITSAVERVITTAEGARSGEDAPALLGAFTALTDPDPAQRTALQAAAEVLVAAHFDATLHTAVAATLAERAAAWFDPSDERGAGVRGFLLLAAVGGWLLARHPGAPRAANPGTELPEVGTGDPRHDSLLRATLDLIAENGFDRTTIAAIAQRIGLTQGFLFGRYGTKLELFIDAYLRDAAQVAPARAERCQARRTALGDGAALAHELRERMRPNERRRRRLDLEWLRCSWREVGFGDGVFERGAAWLAAWAPPSGGDPTAARGFARALHALDHGALLLGGLMPHLHAVAFEAATTPWLLRSAGAPPRSVRGGGGRGLCPPKRGMTTLGGR